MAFGTLFLVSLITIVIGIIFGFLIEFNEESYLRALFTLASLAIALQLILPFIVSLLDLKNYASYISIPGISPIYTLIGSALLVVCLRGFKFL